jgi:aminoglycoside phosphotransferase (APT) family kinase protein
LLELTADNAADYLRRQGWLAPGPAHVELLSGGVSNAVLRVEQAGRQFVVKQSRPRLRTRDEWFGDVARVYREQEVMQVLGPLLPAGTVPEVLFSDRANYVFAMSHAPRAARVWKEELLAGEVDLGLGEWAGRVLGQIHERTGRDTTLVEAFRDSSVFVQLRVDPYYRRVQERRPEVAEAVAPLIEGLLTRREALCHGDYSPKNMLTHAGGFTLVDYETAYFGDPAMDLGFFLSHLLLKACKRAAERARYFGLTQAFWAGYGAEVTFRDVAELQRRGITHLGACLLARVDGTSPVDYLAEAAQREAVRRLGRALLLEAPRDWGKVLARAEAELPQA